MEKGGGLVVGRNWEGVGGGRGQSGVECVWEEAEYPRKRQREKKKKGKRIE